MNCIKAAEVCQQSGAATLKTLLMSIPVSIIYDTTLLLINIQNPGEQNSRLINEAVIESRVQDLYCPNISQRLKEYSNLQ